MKTKDTTKTATAATATAKLSGKNANAPKKSASAKSKAPNKKSSMDVLVANSAELGKKLIAKMRRGIVEFAFINRLGKQITTAGTLIKSKIPTTRKVAGAVKPRDSEHVVFYDVRHGVRRQFNRNQVVAIFA